MKYLFISLTFLLSVVLNNEAQAQSKSLNTINITKTAEVQLPADLIQFNITLNAKEDTPQEAYKKHQELEKVLVSLLEKYDIKEQDIRFEPIAISQYRERTDQGHKEGYQTRQKVQVTFSDFDIYEEIQVALIKNGFDNFNGSFLTTKKEKGMEKALRQAIDQAKTTAEMMAEQAGVTLGDVLEMTYSEHKVRPYAVDTMKMAVETNGLLQYKQTVAVEATVSMKFEIAS